MHTIASLYTYVPNFEDVGVPVTALDCSKTEKLFIIFEGIICKIAALLLVVANDIKNYTIKPYYRKSS